MMQNLNMWYRPQLQLAALPMYENSLNQGFQSNNSISLLDLSTWLMAVPKSKISRGRKRMGHARMVPDPVNWTMCEKCGEPKRPHRICTKHLDVCALRKADWEKVKQHEASLAAQAELDAR
jgi:large subunit ribosomal protein L32